MVKLETRNLSGYNSDLLLRIQVIACDMVAFRAYCLVRKSCPVLNGSLSSGLQVWLPEVDVLTSPS
jgi:hypothetical protein